MVDDSRVVIDYFLSTTADSTNALFEPETTTSGYGQSTVNCNAMPLSLGIQISGEMSYHQGLENSWLFAVGEQKLMTFSTEEMIGML